MLTSLTVCVHLEAGSGTDVSFQRCLCDASPPVTTGTGRRHLSGDVASLLLSMRRKVPQLVKSKRRIVQTGREGGGVERLLLYIGDSVSGKASKEVVAVAMAISQRQGSVHVCVCVME